MAKRLSASKLPKQILRSESCKLPSKKATFCRTQNWRRYKSAIIQVMATQFFLWIFTTLPYLQGVLNPIWRWRIAYFSKGVGSIQPPTNRHWLSEHGSFRGIFGAKKSVWNHQGGSSRDVPPLSKISVVVIVTKGCQFLGGGFNQPIWNICTSSKWDHLSPG